ncbi:MAG TPA: 2-phosphosulfolactate phosphatase [Anaerolineales bacterium]|nr:2-phosphosulfolactate phosphatase [Anaerolineales bacterium]
MKFTTVTLDNCSTATGVVVVIDVIRAFTTAAIAFSKGAKEITLVSTVDEAFEWRKRLAGSILMGEVGGLPIKGFDLGNSPFQLSKQDLSGKELIQRTSAGTQGAVLSENADILLATSFVCATATARYIQQQSEKSVTFVITGAPHGQGIKNAPTGLGDEDKACTDYIQAILSGPPPNPQPFIRRVLNSPSGKKFSTSTHPDISAKDLEYCTAVDLFDFAMLVTRTPERLILRKTVI